MIKMLTQDNCGQCIALKKYLDLGLRGKYNDVIEVIKKEDNPEEFMRLVKLHGITSTPALIADNEVLRNPNVSNAESFIKLNS